MKKIIIIVAGVLVLLGGGGAGVYFLKPDLLPAFIRPMDAAAGKDGKKTEEPKAEHEVGADLDVFAVNYLSFGQNLAGDLEIARPEIFASLLLTGVDTYD